MDKLPINVLDLAIIAILLISGIFAFVRGFVHEVLAVAAWVGAVLVTLKGLPLVRPLSRQYISNPTIADVAGGAVLFLGALLIFAIITKAVSRRVQQSALNSVDSSLGFVYGVLRGAVIVSLAFIVMSTLFGEENPPTWLSQAKSLPLLTRGAALLRGLVPDDLGEAERKVKDAQDEAQKLYQAKQTYETLTSPQPRRDDTDKPSGGYSNSERQDMTRLLQNHQ